MADLELTDGLKWPLRVSEDRRHGVLVLALSGRMGRASAHALRQTLDAAMAGGERRLVIDLGGVDYVSSAGVLVLAAANAQMQAQQGALVLCALTEPVRIVLNLVDAAPQFTIEPSRDQAVARLAGR